MIRLHASEYTARRYGQPEEEAPKAVYPRVTFNCPRVPGLVSVSETVSNIVIKGPSVSFCSATMEPPISSTSGHRSTQIKGQAVKLLTFNIPSAQVLVYLLNQRLGPQSYLP